MKEHHLEFRLRYLRAHADPRTRALHAAGTLIATGLAAGALARRDGRLGVAALVCGYGPAWFAHAPHRAQPARDVQRALRSLASDYRMCALLLTGRLGRELTSANSASADTSRCYLESVRQSTMRRRCTSKPHGVRSPAICRNLNCFYVLIPGWHCVTKKIYVPRHVLVLAGRIA